MLGGIFDRGHCPIGVDMGSHSIRLLQLARRGGKVVALAAASAPNPVIAPGGDAAQSSETIVKCVRDLLTNGGFAGREAVACLSGEVVQFKNVRLPRMPAEELRSAAEWEATDRLKLVDGEAMVQFYDAGEVRQGEESREELILMAASTAAIDAQMRILTQAGLQPLALDVEPSALARALAMAQGNEPEAADAPRLILDVGFSATKAVILRQGRIVFYKAIDIGGHKFDQAIAKHLKLDDSQASDLRRRVAQESEGQAQDALLFGSSRRDEMQRAVFEAMRPIAADLAREVGLCLRYYSVTFRGKRPETAWLTGGEAGEPNLARVLTEDAALQVKPASPLSQVDCSRTPLLQGGGPLSQWSVAAGLSLREVSDKKLRGAA